MLGTLDLAPKDKPGQRGYEMIQHCFDAGLVMKTTGDALLLSPPFICEDKHLDEIFTKVCEVLSKE